MRAWLPVAAYMALIFYFSSLPHPEEKLPRFLFEALGDKLLHMIEYAVLGVLCYRAFRRAAGPFAAGTPWCSRLSRRPCTAQRTNCIKPSYRSARRPG